VSIRNLLRRAEKMHADRVPRECRCSRPEEPYEPPAGCVELQRREGRTYSALCYVCGGEYPARIIEIVVVKAGEAGASDH
jgi:hypothetical protein